MSWRGHWATIAPTLRHLAWARAEPEGTVGWTGSVTDPQRGALPLGGRYHAVPGSSGLLVIVHGLGGDHESFYALAAARAAARAGLSSLRLSLRGAIPEPRDLYHAGLTADLHAALAAPEFASYAHLYALGYSLGGNLVLCAATEPADPRLRAVAASCAPVDLDRCCRFIDEDGPALYRRWILNGLKAQYRRIASHAEVPLAVEEADAIGGFRHWDGLTIAPRFGFDSAEDYYRRMSAGLRKQDLRIPALLVQSREDPIVASTEMAPSLAEPAEGLTLHWVDGGGHIGLPRDLRIGAKADAGFENQAIAWLRSRG